MSWIADKVFANADDFLDWLDKGFGDYIEKHISENHVHHTWKPNHSNYPKYTTLQLHKNMRNFHVNTNKWDDIAQNITIGKDGDIITGRDIRWIPISAKYYNGTSSWHPFAYEMIGNFDKGNDKLDGKQLDSAIKISRYFYLKGKGVKFHRELLINGKQPKTCPGTGIEKDWFMDLVKGKPVVKSVIIEGEKPKYHTIEKGDTFYSIAKKYGFTVKQIEDFNPRVDAGKLQIGDIIHLIPVPNQPKYESKPVEKKSESKPAPKPQPKKDKYYLPNKVLRKGMKGSDVLAMQKALSAAYFYPDKGAKNNGCDGIFGSKTESALKRFQSVHANPVDGMYGQKTRNALDRIINK